MPEAPLVFREVARYSYRHYWTTTSPFIQTLGAAIWCLEILHGPDFNNQVCVCRVAFGRCRLIQSNNQMALGAWIMPYSFQKLRMCKTPEPGCLSLVAHLTRVCGVFNFQGTDMPLPHEVPCVCVCVWFVFGRDSCNQWDPCRLMALICRRQPTDGQPYPDEEMNLASQLMSHSLNSRPPQSGARGTCASGWCPSHTLRA